MTGSQDSGSRRAIWSVSALLLAANDALQARFGACTVRGELSGFTRAASGHCYFNLKDTVGGGASLRCAMFRRAATLLDFSPRDGQQVELRGRVAVYEARGELQLIVEAMQPLGAGTLYEQFLRLKARLEGQGLFDGARKRPLPSHPRSIGVVTSLGAAALHDVLTTLARRAPHVRVVIYPSLVQGSEAPQALIEALAAANRRAEVDVLLLCRGGGSLEDLWAFNDERLVRAIAASSLPVICGIGHETDVTLADLAADLRAPTPTGAAELVAPAVIELRGALDAHGRRAERALRRSLEGHAIRLDRLGLRLARPAQSLMRHFDRLERQQHRHRDALTRILGLQARAQQETARRLQRAAPLALQRAADRLAALQARLQSLDPRRVLGRGYAWISDSQGRAIVSSAGLQPGQRVRAVWSDGEASAELIEVRHGAANPGG